MSVKSDEKNQKNNEIHYDKSEEKEDDINGILSALKDEEEEEEEEQNINFNKIKNDVITNTLEKEDKIEEKNNEKYQTNEITTTKNTTNLFKIAKFEDVENIPNINLVQSSAVLNENFENFKNFEDFKNIFVKKIPELVEIQQRGNKEEQVEKTKYFNRIKLFIEKPKKYAFVYKTGKIVCYGSKSIKESKNACFKCVNIINSCGFNIKLRESDIKINNISGTFNLNFKINLKKYQQKLKEENLISYNEPDSFSGVVYKDKETNFFIKTFSSGKLTFGGAKDESLIMKEYKKIYPLLCQCKI